MKTSDDRKYTVSPKRFDKPVLFLIFSFHVGGIERQLAEMANGMARRGMQVHLCVINHSYDTPLLETLDPQVQLLLLKRGSQSGSRLSAMKKLADYVKKNDIRVIHAQEPTGVVFAAWAKLRCPGLRIVETIHDIGEANEYANWQLKAADFLCDRYVAISESVKKEILGRGIARSRIDQICNAVNTEKFTRKRQNSEKAASNSQNSENAKEFAGDSQKSENSESSARNNRKSVNLEKFGSENICNIVQVARLFPAKKGQDLLLEAAVLLRDQYPALHWHIYLAGEVYRGQEEACRGLHAFVKEHDLSAAVTFCGNVEDVPALLQDMDLFVLPSRYEGFGIAIIEAMAMGIPCVASRLDGPREILEGHPQLGRLFTPGDSAELAEQIAYVMEHRQEFPADTLAAYAKENYGMQQFLDRHVELYESMF